MQEQVWRRYSAEILQKFLLQLHKKWTELDKTKNAVCLSQLWKFFPFDHCLPGNLGAFKVFRDLHWHSFAFYISSSLENSWQDKFFPITKGHQGLVTYGHPCNIPACNCSRMWNVEAIKIAEGDWAYKQNGSLVDVKGALTELTMSSMQLTSCTVPSQQQVRCSLQPAAASIPTHCDENTATAMVQH